MNLKLAKRKVYSKGYNIYAYIGRFKKYSKLREELPEQVLLRTCQDFLTHEDHIRQPFPYFLRLVRIHSEEYFSKKEQVKDETVNTQLIGDLMKCLK